MRLFLTVAALLLAVSSPSLAESTQDSEATRTEQEQPVKPVHPKDHPSLTDAERTRLTSDGNLASDDAHYFVVVEGKGMPVREISLNGINVLGGSVISLSMPIDVTRDIKLGLNEIKVRYVSHETEGLVTLMEKRTSGPKRVEVVKLELPPKHSQGQELSKELAFNVEPAPLPPQKIELSEGDRREILSLVDRYYKALKSKDANKLRTLYATALKEEQKIFPEGAEFFTKVLKKEIALMKRKDVKMNPFDSMDVMLEQDGYRIRAVRKDRRPMMESNEVEVDVEPMLAEVEPNNKIQKTAREQSKQRLVTTSLHFKKLDGNWCLALPRGI